MNWVALYQFSIIDLSWESRKSNRLLVDSNFINFIYTLDEFFLDVQSTEYYTEGSLDEKSVTRIGSCQGGECLDALAKNFIPASA